MAISKRKNKKNNQRGKRIFLSLTLACLLFGVIALIVYFSHNDKIKQTRPSFSAKTTEDEAKIAIPPEKTWEYIKLLEEREVDKPIKNEKHSALTTDHNISEKSKKSVAVTTNNTQKTSEIDANSSKKTVEIKNVTPSKANKTYSLQCAAFKNKDSADKLQVQLLLKGFDANVAKSGAWYRVYVAGFSSKNQAINAKNKIKIVNCVLIK